jgi:RsmE family RNA methyltransferase
VLRLEPGDPCEVVVSAVPAGDAKQAGAAKQAEAAKQAGAAVYAATVSSMGDLVTVTVGTRLGEGLAGASYRYEVGVVQALARPAVMDYVFEKGTEVGASFFLLVSTAGSPRWAATPSGDRLDRWTRIVREAAKQSKHVSVPWVLFAGSLTQAIDHVTGLHARSLVLEPGASRGIQDVFCEPRAPQPPAGPLALWVGPEGGWSAEETEQLRSAGLTAVRLGRSVLRTETAGPVAVAAARLLLGDW